VTDRTTAGTVVDVTNDWPARLVVVKRLATEAVSRRVARAELVTVLPPEVIIVATLAITMAALELGTAKGVGLVEPGAIYRVESALEEEASIKGFVLPDGIVPALDTAAGELPAEEGKILPPVAEEGAATLPGALPAWEEGVTTLSGVLPP